MNNTLTHPGGKFEFDFSPKVALKLEAQAKIWFGDLHSYLNSGVSYDFALWVALLPPIEGEKMDFEAFEDIIAEIDETEVEKCTLQLREIMGFFVKIALRNTTFSKEQKAELTQIWMAPFMNSNPTASAS